MKRLILTMLACLLAGAMSAQIDQDWEERMRKSMEDAQKEFDDFKKAAEQSFESFRKKANEEYARFMADPWVAFEVQPVEPIPTEPKPPQPIRVDPDNKPLPSADPIIFKLKPKPDTTPYEQPQPVEPITPNILPETPLNYVTFYGTDLGFHFSITRLPKLNGISEKSVSNYYLDELSNEYFDNLVTECLHYRQELNLCDWGYFLLTRQLSESYFGKTDEARVLQLYLLVQSGYKTRIASRDNHLVVLMASDEAIWTYCFINIDGQRFYNFEKTSSCGGYYSVHNHAFPGEKKMSLVAKQPKLTVKKTTPRQMGSKSAKIEAAVVLNQNLIDFFNDYPISGNWTGYAAASLSDMAKDALYPVMRSAIAGKSKPEAANILMGFMHFAFDYASDKQQFGYERPLFPDESLFYPYNDCEDRSIFYSCLVQELLGLEVVLLHYPGHVATAVCFNEDVKGNFLMIDGKRFIVCDPTYIGSKIGMCMPQFKNNEPEVVRF